jgi:hypothetical protein
MSSATGGESQETVTDTYVRRRLFENEDRLDATVQDLWTNSHNLYLQVDVLEEQFYITVPTPNQTPTRDHPFYTFYSHLINMYSTEVSLETLVGETLSVYIDDSFEECFFTDEKQTGFVIKENLTAHSKNSVIGQNSKANMLDQYGKLAYLYEENAGIGWELTIDSYEELDSETFSIAVGTQSDQHIFFEFTVDKSTDPEESETAKVVEELGGGLPNQLKGSTVYLFHKEHLYAELNSVASDTLDTWKLVLPSEKERFTERRMSHPDSDEDQSEGWLSSIIQDNSMLVLLIGVALLILSLDQLYVLLGSTPEAKLLTMSATLALGIDQFLDNVRERDDY